MANDQAEISKTSIADIALSLLKPAAEQAEDTLDDVTEVEQELPPEGNDADETDDTTEEALDESEDTADAEPTFIDINDDDVIDVMIDGVLEQRTIGDLKKALSGEGAIEKRLQEATETRKTAHAERTVMLETLAANESIFATALSTLDSNLFKGVIPAPDERMRNTNPDVYLRHKEAYDADQQRINAAKAAIAANVKAISAQRDARLKEYGKEAATRIAELIPELADPVKSTPVLQQLMVTARAYGYTDQEIGSALDPRMFHLMRDAMRYRDLLDSGKKKGVVDLSGEQSKPIIRKLRSGGAKAKTFAVARAKEQAQATDRAKTTGKVSDVAATLLVTKRK